jgi:D-3-phosphoglycerate dehydrogenase
MKILVCDPIAEDGVEILRRAGAQVDVKTGLSKEDLAKIVNGYDALVVRSETKVTREILDAAAHLQVVGRAGVGVDNIDVGAATEKGVVVSTPRRATTPPLTRHRPAAVDVP